MIGVGDDQEDGPLAGKLLGEIEVKLPFRPTPDAALPTGDVVYLRREGEHSIRIETHQQKLLGHVPSRIGRWLAPLIDQRVVWLEAYVKQLVPSSADRRQHLVILASVYLHRSRLDLLAPQPVTDAQQALHQLVLATYFHLPRCRKASEVRTLHGSLLRKIGAHRALPETYLLLALFPRVADELDVARRMVLLGKLSEYLASLEIESPRQSGPVTMFPLLAPSAASNDYLLFHHEQVETALVEREDVLLIEVVNDHHAPLLAFPGELFYTARGSHALATAALVPPHGAHQVLATPLELEQPFETPQPAGHAVPLLRGSALAAIIGLTKAAVDQRQQADRRARASRYVAQLYERLQTRRSAIARRQQELQPPPEAVGAVLMRGEQLVGLELCATPAMFQTLWPRVSLSYVAESFTENGSSKAARQRTARHWMCEAGDHLRAAAEQAGRGDSFVVHHEAMTGTALFDRARLCHFTACGVPAERN